MQEIIVKCASAPGEGILGQDCCFTGNYRMHSNGSLELEIFVRHTHSVRRFLKLPSPLFLLAIICHTWRKTVTDYYTIYVPEHYINIEVKNYEDFSCGGD